MTSNGKFKKLIRAHARKTGIRYTAARRSFLASQKEESTMAAKTYDLESLLQAAHDRAVLAGLNWVGVAHVLLVLADDEEKSTGLMAHVDDIQRAINERATNPKTIQPEATDEFVRLAQLLTFQKQFTPGGCLLTSEMIQSAVMQDNPDWKISRLIKNE